jgi:hypothetical protein
MPFPRAKSMNLSIASLYGRDLKKRTSIPCHSGTSKSVEIDAVSGWNGNSAAKVVHFRWFLGLCSQLKDSTTSGGKVEFYFGELFPRVGFIVTNLETPSRAVVRFYNKRGTAEQWIKRESRP